MPIKFTGKRATLKKVGRNKYVYKKKPHYTTRAKLTRSMRPKTYAFKRDIEQAIQINVGAALPAGWAQNGNAIGINLGWSLGSLGATSADEFSALFQQYKLNGARIKMFFSNTQSAIDGNDHYSNSQLIIRMAQNQDGLAETLDASYWQQIQAKKYRTALNGGRPLQVYMPLKLVNTVAAAAGNGRTMMKPRYLPSTDTGVVHYGLNLAIERADGQAFTSGHGNAQYVRLITTLYFTCRGLQ